MNVALGADLSQTCGQQKFDWPTLLLWLVCSEGGWKEVKRHRVDWVSPEGRGDQAACRGASLAKQSARGSRGERQGQPVQHCTSQSLYFLLLSATQRSETHQSSYTRWTRT